MEINLINKTAWVFGASRGIGRAVSLGLAQAGANVLLLARSPRLWNKLKTYFVLKNQQHDILCVDMSKPESLLNSIKNYHNKSCVDIVINNSGDLPVELHTQRVLKTIKKRFRNTFCRHKLLHKSLFQK